MKKRSITTLLFLILFGQTIHCETIHLSDDNPVIFLKEQIEIAEDQEFRASINDVMTPSWDKKFIKYKNYQIETTGKKVFWIRFDVKNDSIKPQSQILEFDYYRNYVSIELFMTQSSVIDKKEEIPGMNNSKRDLKYRNTVFMLDFPGSSTVTVYLRLEITCNTILNFYLHNIKEFLSRNRSEQLFWGVFLGILLVMALYNLFLFFSFRDPCYLFLTLFSLSLLVIQGTSTGILSENFTFLQGFDDKIFSLSIPCSVIFFMLFTRSLLGIKKYLPKTDFFMIFTSPVLPAISMISIFFPNIVFLRNCLIFIFCLLLEFQAVIIACKGSRRALYFLFITGILLLSVIINIFHRFIPILQSLATLLPDTVSTGYMTLIALFSFYLTSSIQNLQKEKIIEREKSIQNLEKVNRMKDDFLANTSHELRTPLHGIIGLSESLMKKEEVTETVRDSLSLISVSGKRLFNLINDILDFSKIKNNGISLESKSILLQPLIVQVIQFANVLIGKKDIKIRNNTPADIPAVKGDENRILQILYNLVGNAVKFTSQGYIDIDCKREDTHVAVTIKDTGIGMDKEDLDEIFTPFYQADAGINRSFPGTGIGLTIARHLVELHEGVLKVVSQKGKGSQFEFTLPFRDKNEKEIAETAEQANEIPEISHHNLTIIDRETGKSSAGILAVDDDPINIYIIQDLLANENYNIYTAQDGKHALEILEDKKRHVDLVLLDVMMPSISGYDLCRHIRKQYNLYQKPVLLLTAKQQEEDLLLGFEAGANDYLTKPFNTVELLSRVKSLIKLRKITMENDILESSNTLKTRLLNMASHGLKNPLTIINGNISLLLRNGSLTDQMQELIKSMKRASDKMLCLIHEFLENAMIEEGKLILNRELVNLNRLLKISVSALQAKAELKKQKLILTSKESVWIKADETYFLEILDNLIGNSIKFSPSGGRIWVGYDEIKTRESSCVQISVEDEGPGMTADDLLNAFKPFSSLSAKPTGGEFSTGLGLAIVKQLVELHDGNIEIKSSHGQGCEFQIILPVCRIG
jgi:two-component system, sensor histidine kinase LadS